MKIFTENNAAAMSLRAAVCNCGATIAVGLMAVIAAIALLGWVWEHDAIPRAWAWLLWAASAGGHSTWFAIGGALVPTVIFVLGACVHVKTAGGFSTAFQVGASLVCVAVYFVFFCAALASLSHEASPTIYEGLAALAICLPMVGIVLVPGLALMAAMEKPWV